MISTIIIGFKTVLMRTPWQNWAIVVFCPLVATIFQGVQIDTDHWRHFYWMLGMMWGLFARFNGHTLAQTAEFGVAARRGTEMKEGWSERRDSNPRPLSPRIVRYRAALRSD